VQVALYQAIRANPLPRRYPVQCLPCVVSGILPTTDLRYNLPELTQDVFMEKSGLGIKEIIGDKRDLVLQLAREQGVTNVRVFGSVARGEASPDSDVDFLVDGLENASWGGGRLLMELQELLQRNVDLVSEGDLHRLIRNQVIEEAVPL
jgi:hypothetical protein